MKQLFTPLAVVVFSSAQALAQSACPVLPTNHLSQFTSVRPASQGSGLQIPSTHTFQMLAQGGDAYSRSTDGRVKESFDFTGYVPIGGSSANGYLSINHEGSSSSASGVSVLNLSFNATTKLWGVTARNPVNFAPVAGTYNNCSGGVTPWGTVVTCEENTPTSPTDSNGDGYLDYGWTVELDPATRTVKDQNGDGRPDKLWRMGRCKHENVVVAADRKTVYEGADDGTSNSFVYKYVATTAGQLANGALYVLKLNGSIGSATTGTWVRVPNTTPAECNAAAAAARALGATSFNGVEDVEISPVSGQVYFSAKGPGAVYRFTDAGATVSSFGVFVGNPPGTTGRSYPINYGSGTIDEPWGTGNDNLTFDSQGNLYVLQDGGRNHVWLVRPCHTQASPRVEVFALTPAGSEPTGITLSPDERFLFISLQSPSTLNTRATIDAAGRSVVFNKSTAVVIGRKGVLGTGSAALVRNEVGAKDDRGAGLAEAKLGNTEVYPNPVGSGELNAALTHDREEAATLRVFNSVGAKVLEQEAALRAGVNNLRLPVNELRAGRYTLLIKTAAATTTRPFIKQ